MEEKGFLPHSNAISASGTKLQPAEPTTDSNSIPHPNQQDFTQDVLFSHLHDKLNAINDTIEPKNLARKLSWNFSGGTVENNSITDMRGNTQDVPIGCDAIKPEPWDSRYIVSYNCDHHYCDDTEKAWKGTETTRNYSELLAGNVHFSDQFSGVPDGNLTRSWSGTHIQSVDRTLHSSWPLSRSSGTNTANTATAVVHEHWTLTDDQRRNGPLVRPSCDITENSQPHNLPIHVPFRRQRKAGNCASQCSLPSLRDVSLNNISPIAESSPSLSCKTFWSQRKLAHEAEEAHFAVANKPPFRNQFSNLFSPYTTMCFPTATEPTSSLSSLIPIANASSTDSHAGIQCVVDSSHTAADTYLGCNEAASSELKHYICKAEETGVPEAACNFPSLAPLRFGVSRSCDTVHRSASNDDAFLLAPRFAPQNCRHDHLIHNNAYTARTVSHQAITPINEALGDMIPATLCTSGDSTEKQLMAPRALKMQQSSSSLSSSNSTTAACGTLTKNALLLPHSKCDEEILRSLPEIPSIGPLVDAGIRGAISMAKDEALPDRDHSLLLLLLLQEQLTQKRVTFAKASSVTPLYTPTSEYKTENSRTEILSLLRPNTDLQELQQGVNNSLVSVGGNLSFQFGKDARRFSDNMATKISGLHSEGSNEHFATDEVKKTELQHARQRIAPLPKEQLVELLAWACVEHAAVAAHVESVVLESPSCRRLMVRNIPFQATDAEFRNFMCQFGTLEDCVVVREADRASRGFGFVTFATLRDVEELLACPSDTLVFCNRQLFVKLASDPFAEFADAAVTFSTSGSVSKGNHEPFCRRELFVRNLPFETTEADLRALLEHDGDVEQCRVVRNDKTGTAFGFVMFSSWEAAVKAVQQPQRNLANRSIFLSFASKKAAAGRRRRQLLTASTITLPTPLAPHQCQELSHGKHKLP